MLTVAAFVTFVSRFADTRVVVMVTRTSRKCFALLIFLNVLLTHYDQIGFTAISNLCPLISQYVSGSLSLYILCGV